MRLSSKLFQRFFFARRSALGMSSPKFRRCSFARLKADQNNLYYWHKNGFLLTKMTKIDRCVMPSTTLYVSVYLSVGSLWPLHNFQALSGIGPKRSVLSLIGCRVQGRVCSQLMLCRTAVVSRSTGHGLCSTQLPMDFDSVNTDIKHVSHMQQNEMLQLHHIQSHIYTHTSMLHSASPPYLNTSMCYLL